MRSNVFAILAVGLMATPLAAQAVTIDFELDAGCAGTVPNGYAGFDWEPPNAWGSCDEETYLAEDETSVDTPSGDEFVFNGFGDREIFATPLGGPIDVVSAWFATYAYQNGFADYSARSVTVEGYLGDVLIGSVMVDLTTSFQLVSLNFSGIDKFLVRSDEDPAKDTGLRYWIMDDLTYNSATSVPEPGSLALLGLGLVGLGLSRRRKIA